MSEPWVKMFMPSISQILIKTISFKEATRSFEAKVVVELKTDCRFGVLESLPYLIIRDESSGICIGTWCSTSSLLINVGANVVVVVSGTQSERATIEWHPHY